MTDPASNTARRLSDWIRYNRTPIGLVIAAISAFGVLIGGVAGWFSSDEIILSLPETEQETFSPAEASESRERRIQQLYEVAQGRLQDYDQFLFVDYERHAGSSRGSTVHIYAATPEIFVKVDEQACSYPDGSKIQTDPAQLALLVSCSFPNSFRPKSSEDQSVFSYAVTVVRFFESDTEIVGSVSCECSSVTISSASFDREARSLQITVFTTGTKISPAGLENADIDLPTVLNPRSTGPARVFEMRFDSRWNLSSFELISSAP